MTSWPVWSCPQGGWVVRYGVSYHGGGPMCGSDVCGKEVAIESDWNQEEGIWVPTCWWKGVQWCRTSSGRSLVGGMCWKEVGQLYGWCPRGCVCPRFLRPPLLDQTPGCLSFAVVEVCSLALSLRLLTCGQGGAMQTWLTGSTLLSILPVGWWPYVHEGLWPE